MGLSSEEVATLDAPNETVSDAADSPAVADAPPLTDAEVPADESPAPDAVKTEPPKPETEEQKAEREKQEQFAQRFKLVETAKREQLKNIKVREELQTREQKLQAHASQIEQREAQLSQREARIAKLEAAVKTKDLEVLAEFGYSYTDLTRHHLEANTPEGIARSAATRAERLEQELRRRDESAAAQARVQETRNAAQMSVRIVEEHPDEFPSLSLLPPEKVAQDAIVTRDAYFRQYGHMPTYSHVLSHLEKEAKTFTEIIESRKAKLAQQASSKASDAKQATNGTGHQASRPGTPTHTNAAAALKATPPRQRSEAETDEWALEQLRQLNRGGGARP